MKWMECIPNFSEGRNLSVIEAIGKSIATVEGVTLLHTDIGFDANRTVFTFAGAPAAVAAAAFQAIMTAAELIDMSHHHGEHPRMGACDVCPFVPLGDMTMEEAILHSHQLGQRLGNAGIPVYMYEASAIQPERKNLAFLRKGEYEAIPDKLKSTEWQPDYGPSSFNSTFGMMALGARKFLIAYNVHLQTTNVEIAKKIAAIIRESGFRDKQGLHHPGILKNVKAIGWWMEAYGCCQVSTNMTDFEKTGIKLVFDTIKSVAEQYDVKVTGSELIGLIPEKALLDAGKSLLPQETDTQLIINTAIEYLQLDIDPNERILEWVLFKKNHFNTDIH